ncbi:hypothetical protein BH11PSE3_BH11PSE3_08760 [soil metagenome]
MRHRISGAKSNCPTNVPEHDSRAALEKERDLDVTEAKLTKWRRENRAAIGTCNEYVDKQGVFSDGVRLF